MRECTSGRQCSSRTQVQRCTLPHRHTHTPNERSTRMHRRTHAHRSRNSEGRSVQLAYTNRQSSQFPARHVRMSGRREHCADAAHTYMAHAPKGMKIKCPGRLHPRQPAAQRKMRETANPLNNRKTRRTKERHSRGEPETPTYMVMHTLVHSPCSVKSSSQP